MRFKLLLSLLIVVTLLLAFLKLTRNLQKPLSLTNLTGMYDTSQIMGVFHGVKVSTPLLATSQPTTTVLGATSSDKRIEIDLTNQRIYAYEGEEKVYDFLISSGKWGRTPTGEFTIWIKLRYTLMAGGSKALHTYYYLPNVPYTMYFYNNEVPKERGYGIHGTYWHSNFGHPMSHGCINMKTEEVEQLFYWANPELKEGEWGTRATPENPGTKVIIYGEAPAE